MGMFLDSKTPAEEYRRISQSRFFVDKTLIIKEISDSVSINEQRYFCLTRPRRFGKSIMAYMIASFFGSAEDTHNLFEPLLISKESGDYTRHLNQYHVIFIDFSIGPINGNSYAQYIRRIQTGLNHDLARAYPDLQINSSDSPWDVLNTVFQNTGEKFIFVMDEWDAAFYFPYMTEADKASHLSFLKLLLKGQSYVEFAYMTGVLPIAKYSSGSELNMFAEYDMATKKKFSEYFGFLDSEVDTLYEIYRNNTEEPEISREDLRIWYDGYCTVKGNRLYNPRSVVCSLADNQISSYWTSSGPYDEIFFYIRNNIDDVRDDLALMVSGEHIPIRLQGYSVMDTELNTRNQIYSAMVVYGLLTYDSDAREIFIPNRELMDKFDELLLNNTDLGYVHRLAKESRRMLNATLRGDTETMAEILEFAHNTESPILSYNNETELSAIVNLIYLAARDKYRVEREDKAGKGYVDFIFYPEQKGADAIILELKVNATPEEAIAQIKEKDYALRLRGKIGELPKYTGRILAAGLSYDKTTKKHSCKVEEL